MVRPGLDNGVSCAAAGGAHVHNANPLIGEAGGDVQSAPVRSVSPPPPRWSSVVRVLAYRERGVKRVAASLRHQDSVVRAPITLQFGWACGSARIRSPSCWCSVMSSPWPSLTDWKLHIEMSAGLLNCRAVPAASYNA